MAESLQKVPILLIDVAGFTSRYRNVQERRAAMERLQAAARTAAKFFMPFGDPWSKWKRHGTGDGYYFLFDALPPKVALRYALDLDRELRSGVSDFAVAARMVLAHGDVEWVEDQLLSDAFSEAERFISDTGFKQYAEERSDDPALAATALFHHELNKDESSAPPFEALAKVAWGAVEVVDKHGVRRSGYVLGPGWIKKAAPTPAPPLKVAVLIGHFVDRPLPEAPEMVRQLVTDFQASALNVEIAVDVASTSSLARLAQTGCDLLVYYGHGSGEGLLSFEDGLKSVAHLSEVPQVASLLAGLRAFFVFACHGDTFAAALPCPWVAFSGPILRQAPKGFAHAIIRALATRDLRAAVEEAKTVCARAMKSDAPDAMRYSEQPLPEVRVSPGGAVLRRLSPGLSLAYALDFESIRNGDARYPEHDPFAGRTDDLHTLLDLPQPNDDRPAVRLIWVHGDAGMGKSALLRQFAVHVRDLTFRDANEPLYLLHLHCYRLTSALQVEQELCERATTLYGLDSAPLSTPELFKRLAGKPGTHVWILDDLTYLGAKLDDVGDASELVRTLGEAARDRGVSLEAVVSHRRPPGFRFDPIEVRSLTVPDATVLARRVCRLANRQFDETEAFGAQRLFTTVRGNTAHYKRGLLLASDRGQSFGEYADLLKSSGGIDHADAAELSRRMVEFEVKGLGELESRDGFLYRSFLSACYPMITRASWFSSNELVEWFGDAFHEKSADVGLETAYRNGMTRLVRLSFLSVERQNGAMAFSLPPNQRMAMQALAGKTAKLPAAIPLRGARERLSLALERGKTVGLLAVPDFLALEEDYQGYLNEPAAAAAVLVGMSIRAEILGDNGESIAILDRLLTLYGQNAASYGRSDVEVAEIAAMALFNKGVRLGALGKTDEAIAVYDEVARRFGDRGELPLAEQVASALVNKGVRLGALGKTDEAIAVYDEVARRFGDRGELPLAEQVASALFNKGVSLGALGKTDEEIAVYDEVARRFGDRGELPLAEQVASALVNKGFRLGALGKTDEAIAVYDEVARRFGDRGELPLAEQVGKALVNKGVSLGALGKTDEAIAVYDEVARRFGDRGELPLAEQVASALVNKGVRLGALGKTDEEIAVYDEVARRFGDRGELPLAEQVASALFNKGFRLGALGKTDEAIAVYDEVARRFGDRGELPLAEQVGKALVNKGFRLGALGKTDEAIAVYDEVARRFGDRGELPLAEKVASALVNKGFRLGALGKTDDARTALDEIERRYGARTELSLVKVVGLARSIREALAGA